MQNCLCKKIKFKTMTSKASLHWYHQRVIEVKIISSLLDLVTSWHGRFKYEKMCHSENPHYFPHALNKINVFILKIVPKERWFYLLEIANTFFVFTFFKNNSKALCTASQYKSLEAEEVVFFFFQMFELSFKKLSCMERFRNSRNIHPR